MAALLGATMHAASLRGTREIAFADFASGYMTTTLEPDELLAGVTFPLPAKKHGHAFVEFARRHGDFAIVACSVMMALDSQGNISDAAIALSGLSHAPVRPAAIEQALRASSRPGRASHRQRPSARAAVP